MEGQSSEAKEEKMITAAPRLQAEIRSLKMALLSLHNSAHDSEDHASVDYGVDV